MAARDFRAEKNWHIFNYVTRHALDLNDDFSPMTDLANFGHLNWMDLANSEKTDPF